MKLQIEMLGRDDYVAVMAFDGTAGLVVSPSRAGGLHRRKIIAELDKLTATYGSGTNLFSGLRAAEQLVRGVAGRAKEIIVISD